MNAWRWRELPVRWRDAVIGTTEAVVACLAGATTLAPGLTPHPVRGVPWTGLDGARREPGRRVTVFLDRFFNYAVAY